MKPKLSKIVFHLEGMTTPLPQHVGANPDCQPQHAKRLHTQREQKVVKLQPDSKNYNILAAMIARTREELKTAGVEEHIQPEDVVYDITLNAGTLSIMPHYDELDTDGPGMLIVNYCTEEALVYFEAWPDENDWRHVWVPGGSFYAFKGKLRHERQHGAWRTTLPLMTVDQALKTKNNGNHTTDRDTQ